MRKLLSRLILLGICLPTLSFAVGLGELEVNSSLNEPLNAQIDLVSVPASDIYSLDIRLAPAEVFDEIGIERPVLLTKLAFDAKVENGKTVIKVTSPGPVTEPFLNFVVEVVWPQGRFLREYTALLDPPSYNPTAVAAVTTPAAGINNAEVVTNYETIESYPLDEQTNYETYADVGSGSTGGEFVPYNQLDSSTLGATQTEAYTPEASTTDAYSEDSYSSYESESAVEDYTTYESYDSGTSDMDSLPIAKTYPMEGGDIASSARYSSESSVNDYSSEISGDSVQPLDPDPSVYENDSAGFTYETEYTTTDVAGDDGYYDVGFSQYSVAKGDMLWNIAQAHRSDNVTVSQMMIALLRENPEAFVDNNINRLKSGYVLRIPDMSAAESIARSEATLAVKEQNDLWQQYSGVMAKAAVPQQSIGANRSATQPARSAPASASSKSDLEIVVPKSNQGAAGTVLADAAIIADLENDIQLAQEQLKSKERERAELQSRVAELEGLLKSKDRMLDLKDDELNELQRNLGGAEMVVEEPEPAKPEPAKPAIMPPVTPDPAQATPEPPKPEPAKPQPAQVRPEPVLPNTQAQAQPPQPPVGVQPPQPARPKPPQGVQPPQPPREEPSVVEPVEAEPVVAAVKPKPVENVKRTSSKASPFSL